LFFVLAILNSAMLVASRQRSQVTGVLLAVSAAMAVAGWPVEWTPAWIPFLDRAKCIELGVAGLIIGLSVKSPGPVIAVCAALVAGLCPRILWPALSGQLSIELGLVFLLLQSLRWEGSKWEKLRTVTAATWIVHAFGWTYAGGTISGWSVSSAAVIVLLVYPVILYLTPAAKSRLIPWSALLVLCSAPVSSVARWLQAASPGLVALLLSFALLGVGTWFALSRKRLAGATGFAG